MTLESKIQRDIISFLRHKRVYFWRFQAQANLNGIPDIICLYKGLFLGLELKNENGRPTDLQLRTINAINENGGLGVIVRSVGEVEDLLKQIDEGKYARK